MTVFVLLNFIRRPRFSGSVLVGENYILGQADSGAETDAINCGAAGIEQLETSCYFLMGVFTSYYSGGGTIVSELFRARVSDLIYLQRSLGSGQRARVPRTRVR